MRIKVNASKFEVEVLDRNDKSVAHIKYENYEFDGDTVRLIEELKATIQEINSIG